MKYALMCNVGILKFPLLTIWSLLSVTIYGQYATLTGTVSNGAGEPLAFANVALEGTAIGGSADLDGSFVLRDIPVGKYKVIASYLGYEAKQELIDMTMGDESFLGFQTGTGVTHDGPGSCYWYTKRGQSLGEPSSSGGV